MSCFTFDSMRASLPQVSGRLHTSKQAPCTASSNLTTRQSCSRNTFLTGDCRGSLLSAPQNGANVFMIRHGRKVPRLGRPADQRKALVRSLTTEVIRHGRIRTTKVRAKAIRKYVDKMITLAKRGDLHARRQALAFIYDSDLVKSLFEEVPGRASLMDRNSGYCSVKTDEDNPRRRGDGTLMAIVELL